MSNHATSILRLTDTPVIRFFRSDRLANYWVIQKGSVNATFYISAEVHAWLPALHNSIGMCEAASFPEDNSMGSWSCLEARLVVYEALFGVEAT